MGCFVEEKTSNYYGYKCDKESVLKVLEIVAPSEISIFQNLIKDVRDIASQSSNLHAIDTLEERTQAYDEIVAAWKGLADLAAGVQLPGKYDRFIAQALLSLFFHLEPLFVNFFAIDQYTEENFKLFSPLSSTEKVSFNVYHAGGSFLSQQSRVFLSAEDWERLTSFFPKGEGASSGGELQALGETIATFEQITGPLAGTSQDKGGFIGNKALAARLFGKDLQTGSISHYPKLDYPPLKKRWGQQDCQNEMMTTRQLLAALQVEGVLRHFEVLLTHVRINLEGGGYHVAVPLKNLENGEIVVVDSWPRNNGELPDILTIKEWEKKYEGRAGQNKAYVAGFLVD